MPKGYTKKQLEQLYKNLIGTRQKHIVVVREATPEENKKLPGHSKYFLCKCDCGNEIFIKTAYLQGNAGRRDYKIESCGCYRKIRHFLASSKILTDEDEDWLYQFITDWDRFSFLHHCIIRTSGIKTKDWKNKQEYKDFFEYFWNDKQFNILYDKWKKQSQANTFYDWWKPSLDHIIPKSRGGDNSINNLQFLTYYENHNKLDMTWDEWTDFKIKNNITCDLYLENIYTEKR